MEILNSQPVGLAYLLREDGLLWKREVEDNIFKREGTPTVDADIFDKHEEELTAYGVITENRKYLIYKANFKDRTVIDYGYGRQYYFKRDNWKIEPLDN